MDVIPIPLHSILAPGIDVRTCQMIKSRIAGGRQRCCPSDFRFSHLSWSPSSAHPPSTMSWAVFGIGNSQEEYDAWRIK